MEKESANAAQQRRRAEKLDSSDPEVVAWQLAVERRRNEQKKAKRAAETLEQRDERVSKRRRQEAERRARPSLQQQQNAVDDVKVRRSTAYTVKLSESATATRTFQTDLDLASLPTAQTTQWGSTIDLVYQRQTDNSKYCVGAIETAACYFTDHQAVFVAIEKQPDVEQKYTCAT
uniref:Uncharacterized protein n=1 Tax=Rhipicephalus zambeziensis TaxID=60191 RepID=A0A224YZG1_9ACAR